MLQSQGHKKNGTTDIELCHTDCDLFDAGTLLSYLQEVKSWLDQNPDEGGFPIRSELINSFDDIVHQFRWYRHPDLGRGFRISRYCGSRIRAIFHYNPRRHSGLAHFGIHDLFWKKSSHIPRCWCRSHNGQLHPARVHIHVGNSFRPNRSFFPLYCQSSSNYRGTIPYRTSECNQSLPRFHLDRRRPHSRCLRIECYKCGFWTWKSGSANRFLCCIFRQISQLSARRL